MGVEQKKQKKVIKKFRGNGVKKVELTAKSMKFEHFFVQTLHSKIDTSHKKMDQLVGFLLHPPLSEIGKKNRKNVEKHPPLTFKVLSAPLHIHI